MVLMAVAAAQHQRDTFSAKKYCIENSKLEVKRAEKEHEQSEEG
jgi:molybdopterin synthase catalytic subunit